MCNPYFRSMCNLSTVTKSQAADLSRPARANHSERRRRRARACHGALGHAGTGSVLRWREGQGAQGLGTPWRGIRGPKGAPVDLARRLVYITAEKRNRPGRLPHAENRSRYRVGGAAARDGFDDGIRHAHSAAVEKRDQWPQQRPRPGEMAKLLARSVGKSSLQLVLARSLGTRSLRVSATLKRREGQYRPAWVVTSGRITSRSRSRRSINRPRFRGTRSLDSHNRYYGT